MSETASPIFFPEPPPYQELLQLPDGSLSPIWFLWFYQLFGGSLALEDLQILEAFDSTQDNTALEAASQAAELALLGDSPLDLDAALAPIRTELATLQEAISFQGQIDDLTRLVWTINDSQGKPGVVVICDTHANRAKYPATSFPNGAIYRETDRKAVYITGPPDKLGVWVYSAGVMQSSSSTLADLPVDLGANDSGFEFRSSVFYRKWTWDGAAWHYSDGGVGAGSQVSTSGPAPSGGLWQVCDGSTVACALDNATVGNLTASDTRASGGDNPMLQGGAGSGGAAPTAASKPTLSADATITVAADTDAGVNIATAGATLVALNPHIHTALLKQADFTAAITTPTEAHGGLPLRVSMACYMRR